MKAMNALHMKLIGSGSLAVQSAFREWLELCPAINAANTPHQNGPPEHTIADLAKVRVACGPDLEGLRRT